MTKTELARACYTAYKISRQSEGVVLPEYKRAPISERIISMNLVAEVFADPQGVANPKDKKRVLFRTVIEALKNEDVKVVSEERLRAIISAPAPKGEGSKRVEKKTEKKKESLLDKVKDKLTSKKTKKK